MMSKKKKFALAAALTGATAAALTAGMYLRQEIARRRPFEPEEATITDIQSALKLGRITSVRLVQYYLERIQKFDQAGVKINSVLELNPEALHEAEASDVRRTVNPDVGPLFGVPLLIKDNIGTVKPMHTTAGSTALAANQPEKNAFIITRLKEAGAIILGKTNLTEFANFIAEKMPNGYSALGGQVLNPYGRAFDVGGSSAGTGAAVAANFAVAGIGTETSGSILSPASSNSLVGIKPTVGVISRSGIIPLAHSQDTAGPMARTVTDAAILLNALTGVDEEDEETVWSQGDVKKDYTVYLKHNGLRGTRLGIDRHYLESLDEEKLKIINQALDKMMEKGATVLDPVIIESTDKLESRQSSVMYREFKFDINRYLDRLPDNAPVHSLADVITYNKDHADAELKYGQAVLIKSESLSSDLGNRQYLADRADDIRLSRKEGLDAVIKSRHLDALIFANYLGCDIAAKAGYPSITVPAGYTEAGEPVGVTFTGLAFSEPKLIELAYAFEQATKVRRAPVLEAD
jgi:Asp-tRNAAsn/Glu-tRNAGln amidotransferase A subunit and related amidases